MAEICDRTAEELTAGYAAGRLPPVALVSATVARRDRFEGAIDASVHVDDASEARWRARLALGLANRIRLHDESVDLRTGPIGAPPVNGRPAGDAVGEDWTDGPPDTYPVYVFGQPAATVPVGSRGTGCRSASGSSLAAERTRAPSPRPRRSGRPGTSRRSTRREGRAMACALHGRRHRIDGYAHGEDIAQVCDPSADRPYTKDQEGNRR